jgi:hypothetical protein
MALIPSTFCTRPAVYFSTTLYSELIKYKQALSFFSRNSRRLIISYYLYK